jgi:hypothetical protein
MSNMVLGCSSRWVADCELRVFVTLSVYMGVGLHSSLWVLVFSTITV